MSKDKKKPRVFRGDSSHFKYGLNQEKKIEKPIEHKEYKECKELEPKENRDNKDYNVPKEHKEHKHKVKAKKNKKKGIRLGISTIVFLLACTFLFVVSTFLQLNITHLVIPIKMFSGEPCTVEDFIHTIRYIPQIPIALFVVGLLGRKLGLISVLLYIIAGLFFVPVFALGGGWRYIFEYGFGYILAYIPAAFILGTILKKGYTYKNVMKAVALSVLTIHLIGVFYMMCLAGLKHAGWEFIWLWIVAQSGVKIIYDMIFSFLAVLVSKYARVILWFYM